MIRVEGYQNLYRDEKSGAIVNCDSNAYDTYLSSLKKQENSRREIDEMKKDIDELKSLLKEFLNGSR